MGNGNCDLRYKLEAQNPRERKRDQYEASHGDRELMGRGYTTLDQASNEPYGRMERKTLNPDANYKTRY